MALLVYFAVPFAGVMGLNIFLFVFSACMVYDSTKATSKMTTCGPRTNFHLYLRYEYLHFRVKTCKMIITRDPTRDGWIEEFIKQKWSSGLFWAVGAAEKKNLPTAISMQLFGVVFSTFWGQKIIFNFFQKLSKESWIYCKYIRKPRRQIFFFSFFHW